MPMSSPADVFLQLVAGVSEKRWEELPLLYAEPTDVRHPMFPAAAPPLTTRRELRDHFAAAAQGLGQSLRFRPEAIRIHATADAEVIVAEFEYRGENLSTGAAFAVPCIFVLRVRDGRIVESRDYVDHAAFAAALGQRN